MKSHPETDSDETGAAPPGDWLVARIARTPEAVAVVTPGEVIPYVALGARVDRLVAGLTEAGVGRGSVVAGLLRNGTEAPVLLWALHALGAVLLPLNERLTVEELIHPLGDSGAALLLHDGGDRADRAKAAASRLAGLPVARLEATGRLDTPVSIRRANGRSDPLLEGALALLYTSGTTGRPKGAVLGPEAFLASARGSAALIGARPDDRWLVCMPLFHVGGLSVLIRSCLGGGAAVVHPGFDPEAVDHALDHDGITVVSFVANMLERLLDERGDRDAPAGLRCVLLGGGPAPLPLLERANARGWPVAPTYGLTEAASQVATRPPEESRPPLDGRLMPLPGTVLRVIDDGESDVSPGTPGQILVRGGTVMRGYLGLPESTADALRAGWLHTGDVGVLDAEGTLTVLDRREDVVLSGGENVYPAEIEAVLRRHPAVVDAGVCGVADARFGARPVACWVAADPSEPEPDLAAHCREALAGYKVPVAFHRRDALPRSASGKLLRRVLRESLEGGER